MEPDHQEQHLTYHCNFYFAKRFTHCKRTYFMCSSSVYNMHSTSSDVVFKRSVINFISDGPISVSSAHLFASFIVMLDEGHDTI